jgi:catechol-2,3-dioxygenase
MAQYNDARINSIKYFGTPRPFENFDESKIRETYKMYETVIKNSKVSNQKFLKYNDYVKLINTSKSNVEIAKNMCMKIQGLKIMHFFIKNEKNLSSIMNKMINGAKKISDANGFFIKIY